MRSGVSRLSSSTKGAFRVALVIAADSFSSFNFCYIILEELPCLFEYGIPSEYGDFKGASCEKFAIEEAT